MTERSSGSAILLVVAGLMAQEVGASIAILVFPTTGPLGMVLLRLAFSALVLMVIARPKLRGHSAAGWRSVVSFGVVLAVMNGLFYLALERLPQGVTVTIEVLGPLVLSIVAARRASAWGWAGLAFAGVVALGAGGGWGDLDPLGIVFALGAAASWALYIVSSARVGREFPKLDGLALAMCAGTVLALPFGILDAGAVLLQPSILGLGAAVAILSSAIPYALELIALRRVAASVFAILMAVSPAIAALAGFVLLGQRLTLIELVGIALVIAASIGAVLGARTRPPAEEAVEPPATTGPTARPAPGLPDEPFAEPLG